MASGRLFLWGSLYPGCEKQRATLSLQVRYSSFFYLAEGRMPKSKELLFLCRNVGTDQRSARLCCLCFSPHLAPSPDFPHYFFPSISILFAALSMLSKFLPHAVLLTDSPLLSCLCLLINAFFSFPYLLLSLLPPSSTHVLFPSFQCSCQQKRPTRSCGGCAGPTFFWRK